MAEASPSSVFPRSARQVVGWSLRAYAQRPHVYFTLAALFQAPSFVLLGTLSEATTQRLRAVAASGATEEALCTVIEAAVPLIASSLLSGVLYVILAAAMGVVVFSHLAGQSASLARSLRLTGTRLRPLAAGTLLAVGVVGLLLAIPIAAMGFIQGCYGGEAGAEIATAIRRAAEEAGRTTAARILTFISLLAALVYVVHVAVKWVVMPQAAVLEGGNAARVLWRSRDLVRGRWFKVAGALLVLLILQSLLAGLVGLPFTIIAALMATFTVGGPFGEWIGIVGPILGQVIAVPVGALGSTYLYLYLRATREGYTLENLAGDLRPL